MAVLSPHSERQETSHQPEGKLGLDTSEAQQILSSRLMKSSGITKRWRRQNEGRGRGGGGGGLFGCLLKVEHKKEYLSLIKLINFRRLLAGARLARIKEKVKKRDDSSC